VINRTRSRNQRYLTAALAGGCLCLLLPILATPAAAEVSIDILGGFNGGTGAQIGFKYAQPRPDIPWGGRVSLAYLRGSGGNTSEAVYIWTGERPSSDPNVSDVIWNVRLDASYRFGSDDFSELSVFGGVRWQSFNAKYTDVAGAELLEVESSPFGIGIGVEGDYAFGKTTDLVLVAGLDYYFKTDLKGNNGVTISPDDPEYSDAAESIDQPSLVPLVMAGVSFRFGG
jgi:hypothetical protein